jgi:hypothetical protein
MYINKVTFPIHLFKLSFEGSTIEEVFSNIFYPLAQPTFEQDFANNLNVKSNQDLFAYLATVLPPLMLSDKEGLNISKIKPDLTAYKNHETFLGLFKIRFDIKTISVKLSAMEVDPKCLKLYKDALIKDLIVFVYQYVYVELSKIIVATEFDNKQYYFDFINDLNIAEKYKEITPKKVHSSIYQNDYVTNFYNSFESKDENLVNKYISQIKSMSSNHKQKKQLYFILEENIILSDEIKIKDKYLLYKYIFVHFIAKFFFKHLSKEDIEEDKDDVIEGYYRNFLRSASL